MYCMKTGQVLSTLFDALCDENLNFYHTRSSLAKSCAIISILVRINNFFVLFTVDLSRQKYLFVSGIHRNNQSLPS